MFNQHMVQPLGAVRAGSAASADRHPPVRLREVILIELRCYLRRLGCGHDSPIARRSEGRPLPWREDEDPARNEKGCPVGHSLTLVTAPRLPGTVDGRPEGAEPGRATVAGERGQERVEPTGIIRQP